jgi:hypothetical protein
LFLREKKFGYNVPLPLKKLDGDYIIKSGFYNGMIYRKIEGNDSVEPDLNTIKKIARLQAEFHKVTDESESTKR